HVHAVAERLREHGAEFEPAEAGAQNENALFHGIAVYQVSYIHNGVQPLYQSAGAKRTKSLNVRTQQLIRRASRALTRNLVLATLCKPVQTPTRWKAPGCFRSMLSPSFQARSNSGLRSICWRRSPAVQARADPSHRVPR